MLDLPNKEARSKIDTGIEHKGKVYRELKDTIFFIESSLNQSVAIATTAGKLVYCTDVNKFIKPDSSAVFLTQFTAQTLNTDKNVLKKGVFFALK